MWRLYSCDDHLDLWNLPRDVWEERLPARLRERGPRVVESSGGGGWWQCDGNVIGMYGLSAEFAKSYSAIGRAGIEDDGLRASNPALRLADMECDGVYASIIYGPNLFGLPIADPELKAACLAAYNDWAEEFNRAAPGRLSVLPQISESYGAFADELSGVIRPTLSSGLPLDAGQIEEIRSALAKSTGKKVELKVEVDPSLIGGVVTKIGGKVFDGSVRTQLARIQDILQKG